MGTYGFKNRLRVIKESHKFLMLMTVQKQIILIFILAISLGILRSFFLDNPDFTLIKRERIIEEVNTFIIPTDISGPMMVNLEFSKFHFDAGSAIFIDARDSEDYESGHIKDAINIPYDYYEDYEDVIDELNDGALYIIYCNGEDCSLSIDLADYLYHEKLFDKVLVFEGGWPEWRDKGYP